MFTTDGIKFQEMEVIERQTQMSKITCYSLFIIEGLVGLVPYGFSSFFCFLLLPWLRLELLVLELFFSSFSVFQPPV